MKLSQRLLARHRIEINSAPLRAALNKLRRCPSRHIPELLEMLAKCPAIARMEVKETAEGVVLMAKPARELALFLKRAKT